ncbi:MAG: tRNA (adenosine(37)-N6)-threonylcarbamoyltransferase complex ATPase subunit type 1 TsaE [Acidimicrobiia bacterium]
MNLQISTHSPADTLALGRRFAAVLTAGDVVLLSGRLGSGKTLFAAGIAEGLGITERITSPSFVISRIHRDGFLPLVHADVYRLGTQAEFDDLELPDDAADGVLLIEWGNTVVAGLGESHLVVRIDVEHEVRVFTFMPQGSWTERSLEMLT